MLRRHLLGLPIAAFAARQQKSTPGADKDTYIAGATEDSTPRVAIVLSSFQGSTDHDGTPLKGLRSPVRPDVPLGDAQLEEMVGKAIELGNTRRGDLSALVEGKPWVVIKPQIRAHRTASGKLVAGAIADPRIVRALARWLAARGGGRRITIAERPAMSGLDFDPWTSEWDGAFGKLSYRKLVDDLARKYPKVHFDLADLAKDQTIGMQTPEGVGVPGSNEYAVAATLLRCSTLITVAPLATSASTGVSLTLGSCLGALTTPTQKGPPEQVLVDVLSFRPPDYAILGGEWALEGGEPQGSDAKSVRHNLVLAGTNAVAVDSVGAAVMGLDPSKITHLELAARRGLGTTDLDSIWIRGNEIDEAKRSFRMVSSG
jgi:uncharacterized protein (DUF362 family)